jgi:hypothetical protein
MAMPTIRTMANDEADQLKEIATAVSKRAGKEKERHQKMVANAKAVRVQRSEAGQKDRLEQVARARETLFHAMNGESLKAKDAAAARGLVMECARLIEKGQPLAESLRVLVARLLVVSAFGSAPASLAIWKPRRGRKSSKVPERGKRDLGRSERLAAIVKLFYWAGIGTTAAVNTVSNECGVAEGTVYKAMRENKLTLVEEDRQFLVHLAGGIEGPELRKLLLATSSNVRKLKEFLAQS